MKIYSMNLLAKEIDKKVEELGGTVTNIDRHESKYNGRCLDVEVYFDEPWGAEIEREIDTLVDGTKWYVDWGYDYGANGILFEWSEENEINTFDYPDIDTERYGKNTVFRDTTCDGVDCDEPLTTVVPDEGRPYIPKEHIAHNAFDADYQGALVPCDTHFCSPACFQDYIDRGCPMDGTDFIDIINIGKFATDQ